MAAKWNIFAGREPRRENVKKEEHAVKEHTITEQDIQAMVSQEVNAASIKKQVINYMEDVSARGVRTEALLTEIKNSVDFSLYRIDEVSKKTEIAPDKMTEIQKSINHISDLGDEIKASVHKDNLLIYKNVKTLMDETDAQNEERIRILKKGINAAVAVSVCTLVIAAALAIFTILCYFGII